MSKHVYSTRGVCAQSVEFGVEGGRVHDVKFLGGCDGNLKAISKLVEGREVQEVIDTLKGNTCGRRTTSCADQFACALEQTL